MLVTQMVGTQGVLFWCGHQQQNVGLLIKFHENLSTGSKDENGGTQKT
jgi:hypothetical protein